MNWNLLIYEFFTFQKMKTFPKPRASRCEWFGLGIISSFRHYNFFCSFAHSENGGNKLNLETPASKGQTPRFCAKFICFKFFKIQNIRRTENLPAKAIFQKWIFLHRPLLLLDTVFFRILKEPEVLYLQCSQHHLPSTFHNSHFST